MGSYILIIREDIYLRKVILGKCRLELAVTTQSIQVPKDAAARPLHWTPAKLRRILFVLWRYDADPPLDSTSLPIITGRAPKVVLSEGALASFCAPLRSGTGHPQTRADPSLLPKYTLDASHIVLESIYFMCYIGAVCLLSSHRGQWLQQWLVVQNGLEDGSSPSRAEIVMR